MGIFKQVAGIFTKPKIGPEDIAIILQPDGIRVAVGWESGDISASDDVNMMRLAHLALVGGIIQILARNEEPLALGDAVFDHMMEANSNADDAIRMARAMTNDTWTIEGYNKQVAS